MDKETARQRLEAAHKRQLKAIEDIFKLGRCKGDQLYKPYGEILQELTEEQAAADLEYQKALKDYQEAAERERANKV